MKNKLLLWYTRVIWSVLLSIVASSSIITHTQSPYLPAIAHNSAPYTFAQVNSTKVAPQSVKTVSKVSKKTNKKNAIVTRIKRHRYAQWVTRQWKNICAVLSNNDKTRRVLAVPAALAAACLGAKAVHYTCLEPVLPDDNTLSLSKLSTADKRAILLEEWGELGLLKNGKAKIGEKKLDEYAAKRFDPNGQRQAIHESIALKKRESVFSEVERLEAAAAFDSDDESKERRDIPGGIASQRGLAHEFFNRAVGMTEAEFRNRFGWDEYRGYLSKAPVSSMKEFMEFWQSECLEIASLIREHSHYSVQTLAELDREIAETCKDKQGRLKKVNAKAQFEIVLDNRCPSEIEVTRRQAHPANKDVVVQVASTQSAIEGVAGKHNKYLGSMLHTPVQGEWASLGAAKAAIFRKYIMPSIRYIRGERAAPQSRLGLMWRRLWYGDSANVSIPPVYDLLAGDDSAKWGIFTHCDVAVTGVKSSSNKKGEHFMRFIDNGHTVNQVFTVAINCNLGGKNPSPAMQKKAQKVLKYMYEGILKDAYLYGARKVELTLLGGGAFRNDITWIQAALVNPEVVAFTKASGMHVKLLYRSDKEDRKDPVRDANGDMIFIQEMRRVADFINHDLVVNDEDEKFVGDERRDERDVAADDRDDSRDTVALHHYFESLYQKYAKNSAPVRRIAIQAPFDAEKTNNLLISNYGMSGPTEQYLQPVFNREDFTKEAYRQVIREAYEHRLVLDQVADSDAAVRWYMSDKAPCWFKEASQKNSRHLRKQVFLRELAQREEAARPQAQGYNIFDEAEGEVGDGDGGLVWD